MKAIKVILILGVIFNSITSNCLLSQNIAPTPAKAKFPYWDWPSSQTAPELSCGIPVRNNILCDKDENNKYNLYVPDGTNRTIYVTGRIIGLRYFTATNFKYFPSTGAWDFDYAMPVYKLPSIIAGRWTTLPGDPTIPENCGNIYVDSCIIGNDDPPNATNINETYDVDFRAVGEITLTDGFHVKRGADFHAYIKPPYHDGTHEITSFPNHEDFSSYSDLDNFRETWSITRDMDRKIDARAIVVPVAGSTPSDLVIHERTSDGFGGEISSKDAIHTSNTPIGRYDALAKLASKPDVQCAVWAWGTNNAESNEFDFAEIGIPCVPTGIPGEDCQWCPNKIWFMNYRWHQMDKGNGLSALNRGIEASVNVEDVGKTFHLYSLEIDKDEWRFLFDDCVVLRLPNFEKQFPNGALTTTANASNGYDFSQIAGKYPIIWKLGTIVHQYGNYDNFPDVGTADFIIRYLRVFDR